MHEESSIPEEGSMPDENNMPEELSAAPHTLVVALGSQVGRGQYRKVGLDEERHAFDMRIVRSAFEDVVDGVAEVKVEVVVVGSLQLLAPSGLLGD
jgi:hypothetical protein